MHSLLLRASWIVTFCLSALLIALPAHADVNVSRKGLETARKGRNNGITFWTQAKEAAAGKGSESLRKAGDKYEQAWRIFSSVSKDFDRLLGQTPALKTEAIPNTSVKATWGDLQKTVQVEAKTVLDEYNAIRDAVKKARGEADAEFQKTFAAKVAGDRKVIFKKHRNFTPSSWDKPDVPEYNVAKQVKTALTAKTWRYSMSQGTLDCEFTYAFSGDRLVTQEATPGCTP